MPVRFRSYVIALVILLSACGSPMDRAQKMLYGNWWAPSLLLQLYPEGSMTIVTQQTYAPPGYPSEQCLVYDIPVEDRDVQGALCKKCDPRSCFIDIATGEEFFHEGNWREIKRTLLIQHYTYMPVDQTHLLIEPADGAIPETPVLPIMGQVEFSVSDDTLTLRPAAGEPLILTHHCEDADACQLIPP